MMLDNFRREGLRVREIELFYFGGREVFKEWRKDE